MRIKTILLFCLILLVSVTISIAQRLSTSYQRGGLSQYGGRSSRYGQSFRRAQPALRSDDMTWEIDPEFENDVFTFVRIEYDSLRSSGFWDRWDNDFPDADWNFSYRLQQLTSITTSPDNKLIRLTDPELFNYPFIYMSGVQKMVLRSEEQIALRKYLLNGGFVMMSDFWNPEGWYHVRNQMQVVLPEIEPVELKLDHPIFHFVFDLKELPQITDIQTWLRGSTFEYDHGSSGGDEAPHFWAYYDDKGRMIALLCHNNDLGDGWEREGENKEYFRECAEKYSYPMGINIITYVMTH